MTGTRKKHDEEAHCKRSSRALKLVVEISSYHPFFMPEGHGFYMDFWYAASADVREKINYRFNPQTKGINTTWKTSQQILQQRPASFAYGNPHLAWKWMYTWYMYFWWRLRALYLFACQVTVTVSDSGFCCHGMSFECNCWFLHNCSRQHFGLDDTV